MNMNVSCRCGCGRVFCNYGYLITWPWGLLKTYQLILACAALISISCLSTFSESGKAASYASYLLVVLIIAIIVTVISVLINSFYLPRALPSVPFGFAELVYCILFSVLFFTGSIISFISALRKSDSAATCFVFAMIFMIGAFVAYMANTYFLIQPWQGTSWKSLLAVKTDQSIYEIPNNGNGRCSCCHGSRIFNCADGDSGAQNRTSDGSNRGGIVIQVPPTVLPPHSTVTIVPITCQSVAFSENINDGDGDIEDAEKIAVSDEQKDYSFDDSVRKFDEL